MPDFQIINEKTNVIVGVTERGELITAPISFSDPYYIKVDVAATAFEVVPGIGGQCFVITSLLLASSKTFGSATVAETITIYEANPADLSTNEKTLTQIDFLKNERMPAIGLNLLATEGKSLVAIATDTDADVTIAGYYISS